MVPRVYTEVQEFILSCLQFSEDLQLTQAELDETVRRSANLLLTRTLSGCLRLLSLLLPLSLPQYCFSFSNFSSYFSSLIRKPNLSLLQLIQIVINTVHLEDTNIYLENFISGEEEWFRKYIMTTHLHCICDRADGGGAGRHPRGEAPGQIHVQGHPSGGRGIHLQEAGEHLNCTFCMFESCHECVLHPMTTLRSCLLSMSPSTNLLKLLAAQ